MRAATFLLLAVVALSVFACAKSSEPNVTGTASGAATGDAIENSFDQGFPQDSNTGIDTTADTLDSDLSTVG